MEDCSERKLASQKIEIGRFLVGGLSENLSQSFSILNVLAWASLWLLSFPVNYWFTSQEVPSWPSFFAWRPQFSPQPDLRPTPTCFLHPLTNNIFFAHPSDNNICIHRTTIFFSPIQQTTIFASIVQQYLFQPSIRQQYLHPSNNNIFL